jgi:dTDP-glucose 4,6-dehydratase
VKDRPGHDRRYALNSSKLTALGWAPEYPFDQALQHTIRWYLDHPEWMAAIASGEYRHWMEKHYG